MNYVGCKVFISLVLSHPRLKFYMNYVGCKVYIFKINLLPHFLVLYELCGM